MRIFISSIDDSGARRTSRLTIHDCTNTTQLIRQICKEIGISKACAIIKLKCEPYNVRVIDNWPISQYPIKNGSTFLVDYNQKFYCRDMSESTQPLEKIREEIDDVFSEDEGCDKLSFISKFMIIRGNRGEMQDSKYLESCLNKMLQAVRNGKLQEIAKIIKEEPEIEDQEQLARLIDKKLHFLLNELGDCGRNALHWAIHQNNPDIVSFLIIKGTNPTILTLDDYTPLQLAVLHHSPQIIKLLLQQKKIDINQVTSRGTALHMAAQNQDMKCLEILLQNDVDTEMHNNQGLRAFEICNNNQIKKILKKKMELIKMVTPNISKGNVFKVSSFTYRLKEKILILNPFKKQFIIQTANNQIEDRLNLSAIQTFQKVQEKSWLMSGKIFYMRINLKEKDKQLLLGFRHNSIFKKWMQNFKTAIKYMQNSIFMKMTPVNEQIIEYLNDENDTITFHKRKVEKDKFQKKTMSIMNLKAESDQSYSQKDKHRSYSNKHINESGKNSVVSNDDLLNSQIMLGSVIDPEMKYSLGSIISTNTMGSMSAPKNLEYADVTIFQDQSNDSKIDFSKFKFRKNSQRIEIVSEFKIQEKQVPKISFRDFQIIKLLGNGAFGHVYLSKHIKTNKTYALKVLNKRKLINKKQLRYAVGEANILKKVNSPFIIQLYYAFQTPKNLYMALDNCINGDLSQLVIVKQKLHQSTARFIIAQVVLALQYLHKHNILYRDMKPENILISSDGYIKLTDFGLSRQNCFSMSFCGSPAYLSPQMLQKKGVGFASDIYGLGCVLFELTTGQPPFIDDNLDVLYQNIKTGKLRYPSYLSIEIKSLISKLLERDVNKRIGVKDFGQIKKHDFFKKLDWNLLSRKQLRAPTQMFINEQDSNYFQVTQLQKKQQIKLVDDDYQGSQDMMSKVKNFTFIRQIDSPTKKANNQ